MVAVITGATKGIGKAVAERFAQAGFDLFICSRTHLDLVMIKNEWEKKYKIKVHIRVTDMGKKSDVILFSEFVKSQTRQVSVLVNNAGQFIPGHLFENSGDKLVEQLNVNLLSAHYLTSSLMPVFRQQKKGHIFTIGSILSIKLREAAAFYTISKHAIRTWHQLLFEEARKDHIRATLILPSSTITSSWDGVDINAEDMIQPENIAEMIYDCYNMTGSAVVDELLIKTISKDLD